MRASHIHKFHRAGCLFLECLWNEVFHLVSCIPQNEMVVFAGDMNGHVGSSNVGYDGTHGTALGTLMVPGYWSLQMG